ncbi:hypothetical protein SNE40_022720 [Patella caerulea]|uniref:Uncharacterized protein n=1 Tax=Patella caerulea TaxID=87958 RepID=A0AAN8J400_PATCE
MKYMFGFKWMYSLLLLIKMASAIVKREIVDISFNEQNTRITNASIECYRSMIYSTPTLNGTFCPSVWDKILCWPDTPAGTSASLACPDYVDDFNTQANASKYCTKDGTWFFDSNINQTWADYTHCVTSVSDLMRSHVGRISIMYNIGYGLSLVSLVLAVFIMVKFKRLHCARNTIHINLFASFILRASISFMKENLLVQGVAFSADVKILPNGQLSYIEEGTHWQCKLFFTTFHYILGANYIWVFVEGLYLHMLVSVAVFSEKTGIKWYMLFGWAAPVTFVLPWVIVRATIEDKYCWNTSPTPGYFWIMKGPIVASIVINFIFFLNIVRVLFTKLNAVNSPEAKKFRYQKLAKSTLVLIPLFGVHYIVFVGLPDRLDERLELVKLYFEMFFNSIQGFFVALLFCFLNSEVQTEIKKNWRRFKLNRFHTFQRGRSHLSTFATYVSKVRGSVSSFSNHDDQPHDGQPTNGKGPALNEGTALNSEIVDINNKYISNGGVTTANIDEALPMMALPVKEGDTDSGYVNSVHSGHL